MLAINNQQHREIALPEQLFESILSLLGGLLTSLEKEGSKSLDLEVKIIKHLF